ncbi:WXG100 family type VII secretion target [Nocardia fluminea]|uniref:WXG100 family type VII secretion target n=1 Tax=Nocardia fluminea TaxID=134984 RepID=UPI0036646BAC
MIVTMTSDSEGGTPVTYGGQTFQATPAELAAAATAVRTLLDGMVSGFKSLESDVESLTSTWKGRQGEQFAAGFADVRDGLSELLDAIRDTTVALDDSAEAYLGQEGANAAAIEAVASSLDLPGVS